MIKAKVYNVADSNIALFGSEVERNVKKASAEHEDQWKGLEGVVGTHIWRIENFKVVPWPKEKYGQFHRGDSYIVLNAYKVNDAVKYDVHFWLGSETTQDEAGTAAYKTVELDTLLGDVPVQHREVEKYESELFHSYFHNGIRYLDGGIESGFHHVTPETYTPRLLQIHGTFKSVASSEVPLATASLNSNDVFIVDFGLRILQWNGAKSNGAERIKAAQLTHTIAEERNGLAHVEVISEGEEDEHFWTTLGGKGAISDDVTASHLPAAKDPILLRLSDASGSLTFTEVARGHLHRHQLSSDDTFVLDNGKQIFAWVGKNASGDERKLALQYAQQYLHDHNLLPHTTITRLVEGSTNQVFDSSFAA